ncbi:MAG TPA: helix-turn-helix domain-containing protein [Polyangiaceae bacterium]|nr:helix-turn-helix domain-containing protein [Polyangiaceae bacterium]
MPSSTERTTEQNRIVVCTPDELAELVREAVAAALAPRVSSELVPLNRAGVPVRTLRNAIRVGELVAAKAGREYLVERSALTAWLAARRVRPKSKAEPVETEVDRALARARRAGALRPVTKAA